MCKQYPSMQAIHYHYIRLILPLYRVSCTLYVQIAQYRNQFDIICMYACCRIDNSIEYRILSSFFTSFEFSILSISLNILISRNSRYPDTT
ncbi:uncharacterized protein BDW43DRAFT_261940 [Aspergillus alliaceus]|uniref:uncharacterized protein n=1 Tax=Petromyces alliaceus TaxID=209559 RepID=UPI0012A5A681|nr:uncharacterized protein BDW43DRAFT_261940 [Aspergillus alliaceus]KAB8238525.1 hypothetical protein BDW43DRAFT_261940 [Aspergillus alliaceus]